MTGKRRFSDAELALVRQLNPIGELIGHYVKLAGKNRLEGLCPFHNEKTGSFQVYPDRHRFVCRGCGAKGDQIKFLMLKRGLSFVDAVNELKQRGGVPDDPDERAKAEERAAQAEAERAEVARKRAEAEMKRAAEIWRGRAPAAGSKVETAYFPARGLHLPAPPTIGFEPGMDYWHEDENTGRNTKLGIFPAMLARMDDPRTRAFLGTHITWLSPDGRGKAELVHPRTGARLKAKKMRGRHWGSAIRLMPAGEILAVGEGIETALSVHQASLGWPGDHPWHALPCWAAGSLNNLAGNPTRWVPHPDGSGKVICGPEPDMDRPGFLPPPGVRVLILLEDGDSDPVTTDALCGCAAERFRRLGIEVLRFRAPAGTDFNDLIKGGTR